MLIHNFIFPFLALLSSFIFIMVGLGYENFYFSLMIIACILLIYSGFIIFWASSLKFGNTVLFDKNSKFFFERLSLISVRVIYFLICLYSISIFFIVSGSFDITEFRLAGRKVIYLVFLIEYILLIAIFSSVISSNRRLIAHVFFLSILFSTIIFSRYIILEVLFFFLVTNYFYRKSPYSVPIKYKYIFLVSFFFVLVTLFRLSFDIDLVLSKILIRIFRVHADIHHYIFNSSLSLDHPPLINSFYKLFPFENTYNLGFLVYNGFIPNSTHNQGYAPISWFAEVFLSIDSSLSAILFSITFGALLGLLSRIFSLIPILGLKELIIVTLAFIFFRSYAYTFTGSLVAFFSISLIYVSLFKIFIRR